MFAADHAAGIVAYLVGNGITSFFSNITFNGSLTANTSAYGNTTINTGSTLDLGAGFTFQESVRLFSDIPYVIMRPDHPLAGRTSLEVEDLKGESLVSMAPEVSSATSDWLRELFERHGLRPHVVRTAKDPATLLMLVESGLGITILTRHVAKLYSNYHVHCVDLVSPDAGVDSLALWKKKTDNPCVPLFLKSLGIGPT